MPAVSTVEWLTAIDGHPETLDTDLLVATALTNGVTSVEGIDQEEVDDSIEELIALGFLEDVLSIGCTEPHAHNGCEEHMLEFRFPGHLTNG